MWGWIMWCSTPLNSQSSGAKVVFGIFTLLMIILASRTPVSRPHSRRIPRTGRFARRRPNKPS